MPSAMMMAGFSDELQKIAARKALKLIRQAMGQTRGRMKTQRTVARRARRQARSAQRAAVGTPQLPQGGVAAMGKTPRRAQPTVTPAGLTEAKRVAALPGAVRHTPQGSQIYNIGRGSEGMATAVARPMSADPVQVRKLYDPQGLTTSEAIRRKHVVGQAVGENPNIARYYGQRTMPGGGKAQFSELVPKGDISAIPGVAGAKSIEEGQALMRAAQAKAKTETARASGAAGFPHAADVRPANMVLDARTGQYKVVDFIPGRKGEFLSPRQRSAVKYVDPGSGELKRGLPAHALGTTRAGKEALISPAHTPASAGGTTQAELMRLLGARGRGSPAAMRRPVPAKGTPAQTAATM